jgi:hypothetical protein
VRIFTNFLFDCRNALNAARARVMDGQACSEKIYCRNKVIREPVKLRLTMVDRGGNTWVVDQALKYCCFKNALITDSMCVGHFMRSKRNAISPSTPNVYSLFCGAITGCDERSAASQS